MTAPVGITESPTGEVLTDGLSPGSSGSVAGARELSLSLWDSAFATWQSDMSALVPPTAGNVGDGQRDPAYPAGSSDMPVESSGAVALVVPTGSIIADFFVAERFAPDSADDPIADDTPALNVVIDDGAAGDGDGLTDDEAWYHHAWRAAAGAGPADGGAVVGALGGAPAEADDLVHPDAGWNVLRGDPVGTAVAITFGFMESRPDYVPLADYPNFQVFDAAKRAEARDAIALWADVANITFTETGELQNIRFGMADLPGGEIAHAYLPVPQAPFLPDSNVNPAGDTWYSTSFDSNNQSHGAGSFGFYTLLHEIGHGLGLDHPFDAPDLPAGVQSLHYTVMGYEHINPHPDAEYGPGVDTQSQDGVYPSTLMLYDIASIQHLYGANLATRSGDTVYTWEDDESILSGIWDGGGVDVIDASNQTRRVVIDLEPGQYSSIGAKKTGEDARNNLVIAYDVAIENATGGFGDDTLLGNSLDNVLLGGAGNDYLIGYAGTDILDGGDGYDVVDYFYDAGNGGTAGVTVDLGAGTAIDGFGDTDTLIGIENLYGTNQVDVLTGGNEAVEFERLSGYGGADIIDGGGGWDEVNYSADAWAGGGAGVTVNLGAGTATDGFGDSDTISNIESIRATNQVDVLIGSDLSSEGYERFRGLGGDDIIDGRGGIDEVGYFHDAFFGGDAGVTVNLITGIAIDGFGDTDTLTSIEAVRGTLKADVLIGGNPDSDAYERFRGPGRSSSRGLFEHIQYFAL